MAPAVRCGTTEGLLIYGAPSETPCNQGLKPKKSQPHHVSASLHPPLAALGYAPHDVNDVLCLYGVFTSQPQDLVVVDKDFHHITQEMLGFFGGANCYQPQSMTKNIK